MAGRAQDAHRLDGRAAAPARTPASPSPSQPDPAWKWTVSTVRSWRATAASASSSRVEVDPELGRARTAVLELLAVARAGPRVDPDADARARRPPAVPLDLADGVEVQVDRVREQDVEVALGDVRAGVADLVGLPAAFERADDLAGRAGVDADALRGARRSEPADDPEDLGHRVGLEREPEAKVQAGTVPARPGTGGRSRHTGRGRRRTAACRGGAPAPRRPRRRSSAGRQRASSPGRLHHGAVVNDARPTVRPAGSGLPRRRRPGDRADAATTRRSRRWRLRTPRDCGPRARDSR